MKLVECPRDAMQGITDFIPTELKIDYLNALLRVGYDVLDFGSFVSPKAIPQLKDTQEVLENLNLEESKTELLAIIANYRGAEQACNNQQIKHLGFPLSVSETFQKRNTNKSISEALESIARIQDLVLKGNQSLNIYLSMGFGNPYDEHFDPELLMELTEKLVQMEIYHIIPSDTIGVASPEIILDIFPKLIKEFPKVEWGAHLHSTPQSTKEKLQAVYEAKCHRLDMAVQGFGGCPMAKDDLVGNIATERVLNFLENHKISHSLNALHFESAYNIASDIFENHH
ncbi:MAG: hydroxymethylglutaryl-CoA lyase [Flavobacteriales bacterium]|nr:hydroxymethylglutaryl-CoA lyase [Flavobacteriales bacterium]